MSTRELLEMYKGITIPQIYELLTTAKTRGPLIDNGMRPLDADEYRDLSADKKRQYTARVIEIVNNTKDGDRLDLKQYARDYGIPYSTFIEHYRGKKPNPYIINTLLAHS